MKIILVVAAVMIDREGRILLARRPPTKALAGFWEFPGGKIEAEETPEEALVRELYEELGIKVNADDLLPLTFASHSYEDRHLLMAVYTCHIWSGKVEGREGQSLAWAERGELGSYPMPPADEAVNTCYRTIPQWMSWNASAANSPPNCPSRSDRWSRIAMASPSSRCMRGTTSSP